MKAPDIIYTDGMNTCATRPVFSNIDSNIKYIRADIAEKAKNEFHNKGYLEGRKSAHIPARELGLPKDCDNPNLAELTWEDMFKIVEIDMTLFERGTTQKDVENHFKEVLRRFNEYKQNAREARSGTRKGKGI